MAIRTTVDIPENLYEILRRESARQSTSIRALVLEALGRYLTPQSGGLPVTGPLVVSKHAPGPLAPRDENPHDLILP